MLTSCNCELGMLGFFAIPLAVQMPLWCVITGDITGEFVLVFRESAGRFLP